MSTYSHALPASFKPSEYDVIVGRGKVCYRHSGNLRLNHMVASVLPVYSSPDATKKSKSDLIKQIMSEVRSRSTSGGGFVKKELDSGLWYEVTDAIAREKVSQCFRDALNDMYKSSTTSKTLKRRQERINKISSSSSEATPTASTTPKAAALIHPIQASSESVVSAALISLKDGNEAARRPLSTVMSSRGTAMAHTTHVLRKVSPLLAALSLPQTSMNPLSVHRRSAMAAANLKLLSSCLSQQLQQPASEFLLAHRFSYLGSALPAATSPSATTIQSLMVKNLMLSRELMRRREEAANQAAWPRGQLLGQTVAAVEHNARSA